MGTYTERVFRRNIANERINTVLEIGSRDGMDALEILHEYQPEKIICMECNPEAIELVKLNTGSEPRILLVEKAASETTGPLAFYRVVESRQWNGEEGRNIGASSLYEETGLYGEHYTQEKIEIEAIRVDELCASLGVGAVDLVCMDVQGAALRVLEGFGQILDTVTFIITELEFMEIYKGQALACDVIKYLAERGFDLIQVSMQGDAFGDFLFHRRAAGGQLWGRLV